MALPDFFLVGAAKAGTTALHAALSTHPQLSFAAIKEPKYFLCGDRPPAPHLQRGPGDAHSAQEWVWRRDDYERLFAHAPPGTLRGESTPFYLYDRASHRRLVAAVPHARLIAVVRDPVDRAHSNWMHLWSDGLEPEPDFLAALAAEDERVAAGWAPFWHYRRQGRYGEQLSHLLGLVPREQLLLLRYRDLVDEPVRTLDRVCAFLGVRPTPLGGVPRENVRPYVVPGTVRDRFTRPLLRAGFRAGAWAPPQWWRAASAPLLALRHRGGVARPRLSALERREVLRPLLPDIALLEQVTGESFADWRAETSAEPTVGAAREG
ncbi:MAG: sulfotransferase [Kineosporiaceae bacterium]